MITISLLLLLLLNGVGMVLRDVDCFAVTVGYHREKCGASAAIESDGAA
jgi:hypothetical protein